MVTEVLAPTVLAGDSSDITIATGSTNTVAMYTGTGQSNLLLPDGVSNFLLPGGTDRLLLPTQVVHEFSRNDYATIKLKDPTGEYQPSGMVLRKNAIFKTLGPGIWRVSKLVTPTEFGIQSE